MKYKLTVFLNRVQTTLDTSYFAKHGVELDITYKQVNVNGYTSQLAKTLAGGTQYILFWAEKLVADPTADAIVFVFDLNEWKLIGGKFPLRPDTPSASCITYNGKPFMNLPFWTDGTPRFNHELMHCLVKSANAKGIAVKDVMDTYREDANPNSPTGNFAEQWGLLKPFLTTWKYFKPSEIVGLKPELVSLLDQARGIAGVPFIITSGFRTPAQNAKVGGVNDSAHETGLAVDLLVKDGISGEKINNALHQVGIKRFGYYADGHLHCDIDYSKPNPCYWVK